MKKTKIVALAGNPNVGKSTVFNELTGLRQHTGNWSGKTVESAHGFFSRDDQQYVLVDLPGCYSLLSHVGEESAARDYLCSGEADAVVVVCDATCLERNLNLALQVIELAGNVILCINLMDEAKKKGVFIDLQALSEKLGVPVIGTAARGRQGLDALIDEICRVAADSKSYIQKKNQGICEREDDRVLLLVETAENLAREVIRTEERGGRNLDLKVDDLLSGKWTAFPLMLLSLLGIFWITITGSNYPSQFLNTVLFQLEEPLFSFCIWIKMPQIIAELLVFGVYRVLAWVVSVMLPPMAIFFPLFNLLEDAGVLPRVAFNLDRCFKKCHACGKQALTM